MNIVINGAGEVGVYLAKMLAAENQSIVLIDEDKKKLQVLEQNYDLLGIAGRGVLPSVLIEAQVKDADLFIAVTPSESENIVSCSLAKQFGAKKTLARIDNHEYLLPKNRLRFEAFGIDSVIYPELLAAKQILDSLKMTGVREIHEFARGKISVVALKVRANAKCCNCELKEAFGKGTAFRILAIRRAGKTFIPRGTEIVQAGDIAYVVTPTEMMDNVSDMMGKVPIKVRRVMVLGGSRIAIKTLQLASDELKFKVVEKDDARITRLVDSFGNGLVIRGDGRDVDILREEGIENQDAFVALTGNSETNILGCLAAKRFGVRKTVAEVENLDYMSLADGLGVGSMINKKLLAASHIYQLILQEHVSDLKCLVTTDSEVVELLATPKSKITKSVIGKIKLPTGMNIGALLRDGVVHIVDGDTQIEAGDLVVVFCLDKGISKIEKLF